MAASSLRGKKRRRRINNKDNQYQAWKVKLSFLRKFGNTLIKKEQQPGGEEKRCGYGELFPVGGMANTYAKTHQMVWSELTDKERKKFADMQQPAKFRRFVNNTKYMFSPRNENRCLNLQKKRWLFDELQHLGFEFLPESHCLEIEPKEEQQTEEHT